MGIFGKKKYSDPAKNQSCTEFEVNNWATSEFIVETLIPAVGVHPFPIDELSLITAAVCRFRPVLIFEWGTNIGKSARAFREIANAFGIETHVHSVDLPDDVHHGEHPRNNRGKLVRGMKGVTLHQGDGVETSLSIMQREKAKGRSLYFVDGDHSYESVKRELTMILDADPEAVVLLHDTFWQSEESGYNVGPYKAINDVLLSRDKKYKRLSTQLGLPGMTLIYPA